MAAKKNEGIFHSRNCFTVTCNKLDTYVVLSISVAVGRSVAPVAVQLDRDGRLYWGHDNVMSLVTKVGEHWEEFRHGIRKKKYIWKEIAEELAHEGFPCTGEDCDRKWRNLKVLILFDNVNL